MTKTVVKAPILILDPLEQFDVLSYKSIFFTNLHFYALAVCSIIFLLLVYNGGHPKYSSRKPNLILFRDKTFSFLSGLIKENLNLKALAFFPILYLTFLFILVANLIGMIPYSYTVTSSAALSFFLSITFFIGVTGVGYGAHSDGLFQLLLPAGVPLVMAPFLILVEAVSYSARVFSLGIRLFANLLSGHGLLKILGSFVWALFLHSFHPWWLYAFPFAVVMVVTLLELVIAFLQAYVFIVLVTVYLNDVICLH
jgi:F-type H+-transporting ATPase subunit a